MRSGIAGGGRVGKYLDLYGGTVFSLFSPNVLQCVVDGEHDCPDDGKVILLLGKCGDMFEARSGRAWVGVEGLFALKILRPASLISLDKLTAS